MEPGRILIPSNQGIGGLERFSVSFSLTVVMELEYLFDN